jgi:hypothetical protein
VVSYPVLPRRTSQVLGHSITVERTGSTLGRRASTSRHHA